MDSIRLQLWVKRVDSAFLELDSEKLIERIQTAEAAIDARLFALRNDSDHHEERMRIAYAQQTLKALRRTK